MAIVNNILRAFHLRLQKLDANGIQLTHADIYNDTAFVAIYNKVKQHTMTSIERCYTLYNTVKFIVDNNIPGDFAECGVWRGGSAMVMLLALLEKGNTNRKLYLYDTYEGMVEPTAEDGAYAHREWKKQQTSGETNTWCLSKIDEVKANIRSTGYNMDNVFFIKGKVEDTIPATTPGPMALLRLDTDWYQSTKHELLHLYPALNSGGVLIIDDYGDWQGSRKAVDEYFQGRKEIFMHRIDATGRLIFKS